MIIDGDGAAIGSDRFVVCPAAFNAYVAFNARELGIVADDPALLHDADELAALIDELLWDEDTGMWADRPVLGGDGRSHRFRSPMVPCRCWCLAIRDMPNGRWGRSLIQRSSAGPRSDRPTWLRTGPGRTGGVLARESAWPNMNYLLWLAARRWNDTLVAGKIARSTVAGAKASGWAEYWNPHTGEGLGAVPQSWTALAATMTPEEPA